MRIWKAYNLLNADKLLVASDGYRLDQELVAALNIEGRILLHRLEEHWGTLATACATVRSSETTGHIIPVTSTSRPGSIRPELGRTQYL